MKLYDKEDLKGDNAWLYLGFRFKKIYDESFFI